MSKHVAVLMGGWSAEREISLRSGKACADAAGCRGLVVGGAQVSELHCNFLINLGTATAADIETLGETVRKSVKESSGVDLEWEIKRIGIPA